MLLQGELGTGKTTLVQGLGAGLGIADLVTSPTFAIAHEYLESRVPLYHFDLYRLQPEEIARLHLELYWQGEEVESGIVAIEWAEKLRDRPENYLQIQLNHDGERRQARFAAVGRCDPQLIENVLASSEAISNR